MLEDLKSRLGEVATLAQINALLDWDMQTKMPPGAAESRARHLSTLSKVVHELFTDEETGKLISTVEPEASRLPHDSDDACLVRVARRDYDKASKLPTDLVAELSRITALAHGIWAKARADNDFKAFAPILGQIVTLKRRVAECYGYTDHIYDARDS